MEPHSLTGLGLFDLKSLGELSTAKLIERRNRFLAVAEHKGEQIKVHIPDTGRLQEILTSDRELLLLKNRPGLKTDYTLLAAKMDEGWVLINTRLHSIIAKRAIEHGILGFVPGSIQSEVSFGKSRLDFKADNALVELKGCSLVMDGRCLFPNAPTIRGARHIRELIAAKKAGFDAVILIMALRPCRCFAPYQERDPAFGEVFAKALAAGVEFRGFFIRIDQNLRIVYDGALDLCYNNARKNRGVAQPG